MLENIGLAIVMGLPVVYTLATLLLGAVRQETVRAPAPGGTGHFLPARHGKP